MSVNIQVTTMGGDKILLAWGEGLVPTVRPGHGTFISFASGHNITVRETPAEIMALIAAEERKQARERIAAQILASTLAVGEYAHLTSTVGDCAPDYIANAIAHADVLLSALDAREGAE